MSDIHANLEALEAVLDDTEELGVEAEWSLGDVVGYGPNPIEVIDIAMGFAEWVKGDHDPMVAKAIPRHLDPLTYKGLKWTRRRIKHVKRIEQDDRRTPRGWLLSGPKSKTVGDALLAHGSPRDQTEYVVDVDQVQRILDEDMKSQRICFLGHTHIPALFKEVGTDLVDQVTPRPETWYVPGAGRMVVNVGSVGQPRNGDPRACYVLYRPDDGAVQFRRVIYDVEVTAEKIFAIPGLADSFGHRLRQVE